MFIISLIAIFILGMLAAFAARSTVGVCLGAAALGGYLTWRFESFVIDTAIVLAVAVVLLAVGCFVWSSLTPSAAETETVPEDDPTVIKPLMLF